MRHMLVCFLAMTTLCGLYAALGPGFAADGRDDSGSARAGKAIAQGLSFLQKDASQWKAERKCASCHHGTMTLWALNEATRQGYAVDAGFLAETAQWTKQRLEGIDRPRDPRPGWNLINLPALYLAAMAQNQPGLVTLSADERKRIAGHVARHLEDDG